MSGSTPTNIQEAVMGQPIPSQHPSVVLRSHYKAVRALLAVAMAALIALAAAVVILADDEDNAISTAQPSVQQQTLPSGTRFDGGPDEGTRGSQAYSPPAGTRFDGGPNEGTRGPQTQVVEPAQRTSYQPALPDGFKDRAGGPTMLPQGPQQAAQSDPIVIPNGPGSR
jgi:hypothetical protein